MNEYWQRLLSISVPDTIINYMIECMHQATSFTFLEWHASNILMIPFL